VKEGASSSPFVRHGSKVNKGSETEGADEDGK